ALKPEKQRKEKHGKSFLGRHLQNVVRMDEVLFTRRGEGLSGKGCESIKVGRGIGRELPFDEIHEHGCKAVLLSILEVKICVRIRDSGEQRPSRIADKQERRGALINYLARRWCHAERIAIGGRRSGGGGFVAAATRQE